MTLKQLPEQTAVGAARSAACRLCFNGAEKYRAGDLAGAMADFCKAIELYPDAAHAFFGRAHIKRDKGDLKGALADYNKGLEIKPYCDGDRAMQDQVIQSLRDLDVCPIYRVRNNS